MVHKRGYPFSWRKDESQEQISIDRCPSRGPERSGSEAVLLSLQRQEPVKERSLICQHAYLGTGSIVPTKPQPSPRLSGYGNKSEVRYHYLQKIEIGVTLSSRVISQGYSGLAQPATINLETMLLSHISTTVKGIQKSPVYFFFF